MAGKGGGAWKVAYADFVTAMMAFFLVMWLCAQDQKVRQSVAKYFMDPSGSTNKPIRTGAVVDRRNGGSVPDAESIALGRGRATFSPPEKASPSTKLFSDWMHSNDKAYAYWRKQAEESRKTASISSEVLENRCTPEEAALGPLAKRLQEEITRGIPSQAKGLYQEFLLGAIAEVNWTQLAQELLAKD